MSESVVEAQGAPGTKGLKTGALGLAANVVIGVASTAPAYSLAVSLGLVAAAVGLASPSIMWVAFIPMFCIAIAYYYMNRADPDCGTSFTWVTRSIGPHVGWMTGWVMIVAQIVVIASLAEVAAQYTFSLFGIDVFENPVIPISIGETTIDAGVIGLGILFVAAMTWICYRGIELSARSQAVLLTIELTMLGIFSVVALAQVYGGSVETAVMPTLDWLNPFSIVTEDGSWDTSAFAAGLLITLFIYWGWDTTASVNEESGNPTEQPGRATVLSVFILVGTYLLVTIAAQALHGAEYLAEQGESDILASLANEVLGSPLDKLLIIAVLTSAAASTQTTILPMCAHGALHGLQGGAADVLGEHAPALPDSGERDDLDGHPVRPLVRRPQARVRERLLRRPDRAGPDDRVLLRHHRLCVGDLLPPRADEELEELRGDGRPAGRRRPDADLGVRAVGHRPRQSRSARTPAPTPRTRRPAPSCSAWASRWPCRSCFLIAGLVLMVVWWVRHPAFFRFKPEAFDPNRPPSQSFSG